MHTLQTQTNGASAPPYRTIDLDYDPARPTESARQLIFALHPDWASSDGPVEFEAFKDGITNTLFKAVKKRPGWTQHQIDEEAVLLRAYGNNTDVLIDREREARSHSLLSRHGLAPALLARFNNGLLYRFVEGVACTPEDLQKPHVWPATARHLGQWHAVLPVGEAEATCTPEDRRYSDLNKILDGKSLPNIWTTMRRWVDALPSSSPAEQEQQLALKKEVLESARVLGQVEGLDSGSYVLSHCDLLSGNVIVHPARGCGSSVSFIDYEYATPAPAAFDLANHFAEWGGFECRYEQLPTRSQRLAFVQEYVASYRSCRPDSHQRVGDSAGSSPMTASNGSLDSPLHASHSDVEEDELLRKDTARLMDDVDAFRGMPGLYWGIWALVQATISQIDFDYAAYAPVRLAEYYAWKEALPPPRQTPREQRWFS